MKENNAFEIVGKIEIFRRMNWPAGLIFPNSPCRTYHMTVWWWVMVEGVYTCVEHANIMYGLCVPVSVRMCVSIVCVYV